MTRQRRTGDRLIELVAVILLGIATVGTAWCGLQSSLWSGEEERLNITVEADRAEANRLNSLAAQTLAYDAATVASYAEATASGNTNLKAFLRASVIRPGFLEYVEAWEEQIRNGETPDNLLQNEDYIDSVLGPYQEVQAQTDVHAKAAELAGRIGEQYVLSTVLLAVSLFFAGVTPSFNSPALRIALLTACLLTILISAARLADLPVASTTWALMGLA